MDIEQKVQEFARECGFDGTKDYKKEFNSMKVYVAYYSEVLFTGLPQFILVSNNEDLRLAQPNENIHILTH